MTGSMTNQWLGMATVLSALDRQLQTSVANDCRSMRDELKGELSSLFNKMLYMLLLFVEDRDTTSISGISADRYQAHGAPATILASFRLKQRELTYL